MSERKDDVEQAVGAFREFLHVLKRLRRPDGCPWDRQQTERTMAPLLLEEAFEAADALASGDDRAMEEELGDLAMNLFLVCVIAEERNAFGAATVLDGITRKLVHRHPHVFKERESLRVEGVLRRWEALKREEREAKRTDTSAVAGVPRAMPALLRAVRLLAKIGRTGAGLPLPCDPCEDARQRLERIRRGAGTGEKLEETMGRLLLDLAALCTEQGLDPETALRARLNRVERAFREMENQVGEGLSSLSREEARRYWERFMG